MGEDSTQNRTKDREKLADRCIARCNAKGSTASKAIGAWMMSLVFVWLATLERGHERIQVLANEVRQVSYDSGTGTSWKRPAPSAIDQPTDSVDTVDAAATPPTAAPVAFHSRREERESPNNQKQEALSKYRRELTELPIFGVKIPVPRVIVPIVWSAALLMLLWYMLGVRAKLLHLAALAVKIRKTELGASDDDLHDLVGDGPWWLAPLPTRDHDVNREQLRRALGWSLKGRAAVVLAIAAFTVMYLIIARVTWIGVFWNEVYQDRRSLLTTANTVIIVLLGLAPLALFWRWFRTRTIPDQELGEARPDPMTRRELLAKTVALVVGTTVVSLLFKLKMGTAPKRRPRFRLGDKALPYKTTPALAEGFYLNPRRAADMVGARRRSSGTVHYVTDSGLIPHLSSSSTIRQSRLIRLADKTLAARPSSTQPTPLQSTTKPMDARVNLVASSQSFERAALERLNINIDTTLELLLQGLTHDMALKAAGELPSFRLYDLVAALAVRRDRLDILKKMDELIQRSSTAKQFEHRRAKWNDMNGRWRKRHVDKTKPVIWKTPWSSNVRYSL